MIKWSRRFSGISYDEKTGDVIWKARILKPTITENGREIYAIRYENGETIYFDTLELLADLYIPRRQYDGMHVIAIDGDVKNKNLSNLRYSTEDQRRWNMKLRINREAEEKIQKITDKFIKENGELVDIPEAEKKKLYITILKRYFDIIGGSEDDCDYLYFPYQITLLKGQNQSVKAIIKKPESVTVDFNHLRPELMKEGIDVSLVSVADDIWWIPMTSMDDVEVNPEEIDEEEIFSSSPVIWYLRWAANIHEKLELKYHDSNIYKNNTKIDTMLGMCTKAYKYLFRLIYDDDFAEK